MDRPFCHFETLLGNTYQNPNLLKVNIPGSNHPEAYLPTLPPCPSSNTSAGAKKYFPIRQIPVSFIEIPAPEK